MWQDKTWLDKRGLVSEGTYVPGSQKNYRPKLEIGNSETFFSLPQLRRNGLAPRHVDGCHLLDIMRNIGLTDTEKKGGDAI